MNKNTKHGFVNHVIHGLNPFKDNFICGCDDLGAQKYKYLKHLAFNFRCAIRHLKKTK